ncbi:MAG: SDR family oxidoreductase [bacterium]|nr:SDR family oxidoreductase [bacterium]
MTDLFDLSGRRALITGSSRGIGAALATALAGRGAEVVVHGREASDELDALANKLDGKALAADLSDPIACKDLARRAEDLLGGVDILILNASYEMRADWKRVTVEDADLQMAVNFRSSLLLCQALSPGMTERGWGRIIALGSIQEVRPNPALMVYAAAKAAQANMMMNLARELAPHGVNVNTLSPGAIATDRNAGVLSDPTYRAKVEAQIPAGRVGQPGDCVGACLLLASDAGAYVNGAVLRVDGGWSV